VGAESTPRSGRRALASIVSLRLRGTHKPTYTPMCDDGEKSGSSNADKVVFTAAKRDQKISHHHTGYIGASRTYREVHSGEPVPGGAWSRRRWQRMLPHGPLGRSIRNLASTRDPDHPHSEQAPEKLTSAHDRKT